MHPEPEDNAEKYEKWMTKKAQLLEQIEQYETELVRLKVDTRVQRARHWFLPKRECVFDYIKVTKVN